MGADLRAHRCALLIGWFCTCTCVGIAPLPSAIVPANLSCEYHASPIVDVVPRFSWTPMAVNPSARNLSQAAYQIQVFQVGPSQLRVDAGSSVLWNSGIIVSSQTLHVELPASAKLASDASFAWRVRLWSDAGGAPSPFSANATFGTALLDEATDWKAPWIVADWGKQLRLRFSLPAGKTVQQARVYAASGGYTVLFVNGDNANQRNGNEELGPWTTWPVRVLYKAYDVAPSLIPDAENAIGVWVGRGQYGNYANKYDWNNSIGWNTSNGGWPSSKILSALPPTQNKSGKVFNNRGAAPGGLRLQLNVLFTDGSRVVIGDTLSAWQAKEGPIGWNDVYDGETQDLRLYDPAWATPSAKPDGWSSDGVQLLSPLAPAARGKLSVDYHTPIRAIEEDWPTRLEGGGGGGGGTWTFWFATDFAGRSVLHNVALPAGVELHLYHAHQMKCPNGTVALVGCRNGSLFEPMAISDSKNQHDTFTLAGTGNETLTTYFTYHVYQFVQLEGWPVNATPPTLKSLSRVALHSDNARTARLSFPDGTRGGQVLTKIADTMVRTLLSNHQSVETDGSCERVGWTGDSQASCESAVRSLDMAGFYTKWMQVCNSDTSVGRLSPTFPSS